MGRTDDEPEGRSWYTRTVLADTYTYTYTHTHTHTHAHTVPKLTFLTAWEGQEKGSLEGIVSKIGEPRRPVIGDDGNAARIEASVREATRLETGNQSSCFLRSVIRTRRDETRRYKAERKRKRDIDRGSSGASLCRVRTRSVGRSVENRKRLQEQTTESKRRRREKRREEK